MFYRITKSDQNAPTKFFMFINESVPVLKNTCFHFRNGGWNINSLVTRLYKVATRVVHEHAPHDCLLNWMSSQCLFHHEALGMCDLQNSFRFLQNAVRLIKLLLKPSSRPHGRSLCPQYDNKIANWTQKQANRLMFGSKYHIYICFSEKGQMNFTLQLKAWSWKSRTQHVALGIVWKNPIWHMLRIKSGPIA